jgi:D-alanyl-D-alanine carboxypeptidase/D-alanyl-D-alanine-endopeptidase (penicillin-binding protein 4)
MRSQPTDSLLKPMMLRSDNLFAEQCLLMASQQLLGKMSTQAIIDTLLKSSLKDLPQSPRWVDGSGLSRYNQFTPKDFIWLLGKMEKEFDPQRVRQLLPGANQGTLTGYYKDLPGAIYAKTGTLSGHVALSGYIRTKKGRNLLFSVLVDNHNTSATLVRRSVEAFLSRIYHTW